MLCHVSNVKKEVVVIHNGWTPRKEVVIVHGFVQYTFCVFYLFVCSFILSNYHYSVIFNLVVVIVHWFCAMHILRIIFICILILYFPIIIIV